MKQLSLQAGDVYALQERETGKWFAFQIIQLSEESAVYADLDYWSDQMPTENDLKQMTYFLPNQYYYNNEVCPCWAPYNCFPPRAKLIGNMGIRRFKQCNRYGNWPDGTLQKGNERWNKLPKDQTSAFKKALTQTRKTILIAGKKVSKCISGIGDDILKSLSDFSELDNLPALGRITTYEDYPQLIPLLERRYLVRELIWDNCTRRVVDLSLTHLTNLEISGESIESILLPSSIRSLTLRGKLSPALRVHSQNDGFFMVLRVELQNDFLPDVGLKRLTNLGLSNIRNFSLKIIPARFPGLIWLGLKGKPGYIRDIAEISKLHNIETLTMHDLFGFSADDFPRPKDLPELRNLWIESIPAEAGKAIKKVFKATTQDLSVLKLRSDNWLQENMNNPLRHWDGNEFVPKSKYTKSLALWKEARRRILGEANRAAMDFSMIKSIAIDYVEGFNKLDHRSQFIETVEREDIINAFEYILDEAKINQYRDEVLQIIDERRKW